MLKNTILLIFLFYSYTLIGKNNIVLYHKIINKAELFIIKDKYKDALFQYTKAFQNINVPFGKDLYNAWLCTILINDKTKFTKYANILIKNKAFLDNYKYIIEKADSVNASKWISIWEKRLKKNNTQLNTQLINKLHTIHNIDQEIRKYCIENVNEKYNIYCKDTLNYIDSINVLTLNHIFETNGFPTESIIGYYRNHPANPPIYYLCLLHDRSWNNRTLLDSLLLHQIKLGNLHPQILEKLYDKTYNFLMSLDTFKKNKIVIDYHLGESDIYVINNKIIITKNTDSNQVNVNREKLMLDSYIEKAKKAIYKKSHNTMFKFNINGIDQFDGLPDDFIKKLMDQDKIYNINEYSNYFGN